MTDELTGRTLSRKFTLRRRIGAGGMATVYEALNLQIEAQVAIKVLRPEFLTHDTLSVRFQREAKSAAQMRHPNIVQVLDYDVDENVPYIVMEYLEGCTLSELQQQLGPLPWQRVADFTAQVCLALEYAHSRNVLHRDIKPSNVFLLANADGRDIIKLLDFGIAKVQQPLPEAEPLTRPSQIPGTPEYMAPEQAQGEPCEARTDLYSLGVMMYRLLTGRLPFYAATATETLALHVLCTPTPPSVLMPDLEIPPTFEAIIMKALAKRPEQRWDSARAFREALIQHQGDPAELTLTHASRRSSASNVAMFDTSIAAFSLQGFEWRDRLLRIRRAAAMLSGASLALVAFMFLSLFPLPGVATIAGGPELPPKEEPLPSAPKTPPPASITPDALKQVAAIAPPTSSTPTPPSTPTPTTPTTPPSSDIIIVDDTPPPMPLPQVRVRPPPSPRRVIELYIKNHRSSFSQCREMIPFGQSVAFTVTLSVEPMTGHTLSAIVEESLRSTDYVTCAISVLKGFKYSRFVGSGQPEDVTINL